MLIGLKTVSLPLLRRGTEDARFQPAVARFHSGAVRLRLMSSVEKSLWINFLCEPPPPRHPGVPGERIENNRTYSTHSRWKCFANKPAKRARSGLRRPQHWKHSSDSSRCGATLAGREQSAPKEIDQVCLPASRPPISV